MEGLLAGRGKQVAAIFGGRSAFQRRSVAAPVENRAVLGRRALARGEHDQAPDDAERDPQRCRELVALDAGTQPVDDALGVLQVGVEEDQRQDAPAGMPEEVGITDLAANQNAWLIDRRAMSTRIERLPWVLRARLSVHWPNKLNVTIKERKPVAFVVLGAANGEEPLPSYALIDDMQRVLQLTDRRSADVQGLALLIVTPPPAGDVQPGSSLSNRSVAQALQALTRLRALGVQVSEIAIAPSTGISALADRNMRVLFGEEADLAKKAALFQAIVAKISEPARIAYIDVRSVRTPTVLYR